MQLTINGQPKTFKAINNIQQLLEHLGYEPQAIAIALDGQFIPRHQYPTMPLQENQALEIVAPMQGG